ncbi:MAG: hypothetical protein R3246_15695, partial [Acidimicrobiia bacterium]|nr:hypothetical protein [Acidimicrobiia bacterium]
PGEGFMGGNNPWLGTILWSSLGDCNATGYLLTIHFDEGPTGVLSGTVSARTWDGDPDTIDGDFDGPISATVAGQRNDDAVSFSLSGGLKGSYSGGLGIPPGTNAYRLEGVFGGGNVCPDAFGAIDSGIFGLNSLVPVSVR